MVSLDALFKFPWSDKANRKDVELAKTGYNRLSSDEKESWRRDLDRVCDDFFKTDAYNDKESKGYAICCEIPNECGVSGWVIFLIIVLVLGVLAGGAAAFWFFYWKRKYGGKEEIVEENTESTENSKTVIEIPVGTY